MEKNLAPGQTDEGQKYAFCGMDRVHAKKSYGQHFLTNAGAAERIARLALPQPHELVLEIGPGQGALTRYFPGLYPDWLALEADPEAYAWLQAHYPDDAARFVLTDVLEYRPQARPTVVVGNLPYNISSPILFWVLDHRAHFRRGAFMLQKEVARRIASPPGSREYGILSVLLGWYYDVKYEFSLGPGSFSPPPKVDSGVITLERRPPELTETVEWRKLKAVVKTAFNQRRKQLHNALSPLPIDVPPHLATLRPEQLTPLQFVELAGMMG